MKLIGLTGGIGSGKSTVARMLAAAGFPVVDADQLAREVVAPGQPALAELADAFGADILKADGSLDRGLLAQRAFVDEEHTAQLNAITHPRIRELTDWKFADYRAQGTPAVVYDMPLLVELGLDKTMDEVLVVEVDQETRVRRLVESRGVAESDARARIAAQSDDATRRQAATTVFDNNGSLADLETQVSRYIAELRLRL
ncbi:MAG: dephospho-CoA kinase [Corynebacterium sp.]|nr:dephospho-CoA kinase [Corynebacterium sp.]